MSLTGPALAATQVPVLTEVITNDHAQIAIPPSPIIPVDPCAPVIEHLFGSIDVIGTAPLSPTDFHLG
jgi:hypothetical protein